MTDSASGSRNNGTSPRPLTVWVLMYDFKLNDLLKPTRSVKSSGQKGVFYTHEKAIQCAREFVDGLDQSTSLPRGTFAEHRHWGRDGSADHLWEKARWRTLEGDVYTFKIEPVVVA